MMRLLTMTGRTACGALLFAALWPGAAGAASAQTPFGFTVEVSLSRQAEALMDRLGEQISISAFFHGKVSATAPKQIANMAGGEGTEPGVIELAAGSATIPGAGGAVHLDGTASGIDLAVAYGQNTVNLNINVFSARLKAQDNLLDCSFFDDRLPLAQSEPVRIACKLIGET